MKLTKEEKSYLIERLCIQLYNDSEQLKIYSDNVFLKDRIKTTNNLLNKFYK